MNKNYWMLLSIFLLVAACQPTTTETEETTTTETNDDFVWNPENFGDKKIVRYQIPGFDQLSISQKKLVYYLTQAGLSGRDITYDQNYRYNLAIRQVLDQIVKAYDGERQGKDWDAFLLYTKNVWFSSGIHHHYSNDKFNPDFSREYFTSLMDAVGVGLSDEILEAMFNPAIDAKKINQNEGVDIVKESAVNFYDPDLTQAEVEAYYAQKKNSLEDDRISLGLNSKVVRNADGQLEEMPYKVGGLYGEAIQEIVNWLEKAVGVAENEAQADALKLLIQYYKTGALKTWDDYNIAWVKATEGDIDYINSFIEVYQDPMGMKGSYETIVQIKDFDASARMEKVAANAQYFEDNSTILDEHKKQEVTGISYKVVTVAGEAGDASPSTPIGVNLPNANWIRKEFGSKSVSLGNIVEGYNNADGPGLLSEFANDEEEMERTKQYGKLASKIHTALHEVIGHASGQLEEGVGTPGETLKNYASPLEEARADLVALYYITDPKLIELGLIDSEEVGKAEYDSYLKNGLMLQLRRIKPGKTIEQAHMRNRSMVSHWVYEKAGPDVVEMVKRDGKTYVEIKDYAKLRTYFGELLREVQRIKSTGDFAAGKALIEQYGVKVDPEIHAEVLSRSEKLNIPPYGGFINPRLVPVMGEGDEITDIKVEYPDDFTKQMLEYGEKYSFLPVDSVPD
ncbi:MAG: dipeptidyl-peptidase III [Nitrosomonas sp.]|nr:MAG: dipeptidyl-peptidase III [Nitrosomonas sp.]